MDDKNEIKNKIIDYVSSLLPEHIKIPCKNYLMAYPSISEIRLRSGAPISFTARQKNLVTGIKCRHEDIAYCVDRMTEGNYMRAEEMMRKGYITLSSACRAGVAGDAFVRDGKISVLRKINYINIRIPSELTVPNIALLEYLEKNEYHTGVLVISPPGCGKTTVLRSLAYQLSVAPISKRVAVVDTNCELILPWNNGESLCDFLTGYPKSEGISIALRYLNPELIICDELGGQEETETIASLQHTGVPLIASAHASDFADLRRKKSIALLLEKRVFGAVMRLYRSGENIRSEIRTLSDIMGDGNMQSKAL